MFRIPVRLLNVAAGKAISEFQPADHGSQDALKTLQTAFHGRVPAKQRDELSIFAIVTIIVRTLACYLLSVHPLCPLVRYIFFLRLRMLKGDTTSLAVGAQYGLAHGRDPPSKDRDGVWTLTTKQGKGPAVGGMNFGLAPPGAKGGDTSRKVTTQNQDCTG
jgi:hypothetical protein